MRALKSNIVGRLAPKDLHRFFEMLSDVSTTCNITAEIEENMKEKIRQVMVEEPMSLKVNEYLINKTIQLNDSLNQRTGSIIVGSIGCGKTTIWKLLKETLERTCAMKIITHLLSPKSMPRDHFIGYYTSNTREWVDGVFIKTCRKVVSGPISSWHWIIVDVSQNSPSHCHINQILHIANS